MRLGLLSFCFRTLFPLCLFFSVLSESTEVKKRETPNDCFRNIMLLKTHCAEIICVAHMLGRTRGSCCPPLCFVYCLFWIKWNYERLFSFTASDLRNGSSGWLGKHDLVLLARLDPASQKLPFLSFCFWIVSREKVATLSMGQGWRGCFSLQGHFEEMFFYQRNKIIQTPMCTSPQNKKKKKTEKMNFPQEKVWIRRTRLCGDQDHPR